jgi:hypothetical protein
MLSSISWQHYLAAVVILTGFYYFYVVLRYYQKEIAGLLNRQSKHSNMFSGVGPAPVQVMGAAKLDNGISISNTEDLQFSESAPDEIESSIISASDPSKELVVEAGNLIEAFKDIDNKPEFLNLFKILIGSYQRFQDEIDLPFSLDRILEIAKEKLQFPIVLSELQSASS